MTSPQPMSSSGEHLSRRAWGALLVLCGALFLDENSPRYILEAWLCRSGEVTFTPIPVYEFTTVSVIDQAGCADPSRGRIFLSEVHGYVGPVEIRWPPAAPP